MSTIVRSYSNMRLGTLVIAGLVLFIGTLYVIGRNEHLFGASFRLRARFANVNGLVNGDNIRFAGIQAGTVKHIRLVDDTTIEIDMLIDEDMHDYIKKNASVSIGSEGLMGNKIINIIPGKGSASAAASDDLLLTQPGAGTDEILAALGRTSGNIELISQDLRLTIRRFNNSSALWSILNDQTIAGNLHSSMKKIEQASSHFNELSANLLAVTSDIRSGRGALGAILADTTIAPGLAEAVMKIRSAASHTDELAVTLNQTIAGVQTDLLSGDGSIHTLLHDPAFAQKLHASMENIRLGTEAFNEDMRALQHNFLLRGFFRKQEKAAKRQKKDPALTAIP